MQVSYSEPLVSGTCGAASHMTDSAARDVLLQHATTVMETLALLVTAAKQAAGNPRVGTASVDIVSSCRLQPTFLIVITMCLRQAVSAHGETDAQASLARSALSEMSARVRDLSLQAGAVGPLVESVARAVARLTEHRSARIYI